MPAIQGSPDPPRWLEYKPSWEYPAEFHYDRDHELHETDTLRPWTPPPEPYDDASYRAWGREHYGEDWDEQREQMINGRDMHAFRDNVSSDYLFLTRQAALRKLEIDREYNHLDLDESKSWEQLLEWVRWLYGEDFIDQMAIISRDIGSTDTCVVQNAKRLARLVREAMWDRHEDLMAAGYTWEQMTEWPRRRRGRIQGLTNAVDFASITVSPSEDSDDDGKNESKDAPRSGIGTHGARPTDLRRMAVDGPTYSHFRHYEVQFVQHLYAVNHLLYNKNYHLTRHSYVAAIRQERSKREEAEAQARNAAGWYSIESNFVLNSKDDVQRQRRARLAKEESLHHQNMAALQAMVLSTEKKLSPNEFRAMFDRWEVCGITVEEGNYLQDYLYGFRNNKWYPPRFVIPIEMDFPLWLGPPRIAKRERPKDEADMARLFRSWDGKLNREQQNTLAKMYGFEPRPESDDCEAGRGEEKEDGEDGFGGGGRDDRVGKSMAGGGCRRARNRKGKKVHFRLRSSRRLAGQGPESGLVE